MVLGIIAILTAIWGGISNAFNVSIEVLKEILAWVKSFISWFLDVAPRPLKIFLFLFFLLTIGNIIFSFIININFVCTSNNELRVSSGGFLGGLTFAMVNIFNTSIDDYDTYILDNTVQASQYDGKSAEGLFYAKCINQKPRLTLYGIDFLNFRYWVVLIVIWILFSAYHKLKGG